MYPVIVKMVVYSESSERLGPTTAASDLRSFDVFVRGRSRSGNSTSAVGEASHTDSDSNSDQETAYTCPCGKSFKRKTSFQRHMDFSHSKLNESFPCTICGKTFGKRSILTMHMSVHKTNDDSQQHFNVIDVCHAHLNVPQKLHTVLDGESAITSPCNYLEESNSSPTKLVDVSTSTSNVVPKYRTRSREKQASLLNNGQSRSNSKSYQTESVNKSEIRSKIAKTVATPIYQTRSSSRVSKRSIRLKDSILTDTPKSRDRVPTKKLSTHARKCKLVENNNDLDYPALENITCVKTVQKTQFDKQASKPINSLQQPLSSHQQQHQTHNPTQRSSDLDGISSSQDSDKENNESGTSTVVSVTAPNGSDRLVSVKVVPPSTSSLLPQISEDTANESDTGIEQNNCSTTKEENSDFARSVFIPNGVLIKQPTVSLDTTIETTSEGARTSSAIDTHANKVSIEVDNKQTASSHQGTAATQPDDKTNLCTALIHGASVSSAPTLAKSSDGHSTGNTTVPVCKTNSIQVTSQNRFQTRDKKQNAQTIVIVIREAKPGRQKSVDSGNSQSGVLQTTSPNGHTYKVINTQQANKQLSDSINNAIQGKMAVAQPQIMTTVPYLVQTKPAPITTANETISAHQTGGDSKPTVSSTGQTYVLTPSTGTGLNRSDVPRSVASVAPSIVSSTFCTSKQGQLVGNTEGLYAQIPSLPSYDSGDTTDTDDGGNDELPPTRKSARLDGKVPGWKRMLEEDTEWTGDGRQRKRKVGRQRSDDTSGYNGSPDEDELKAEMAEDADLNGAAQELLSAAAEVDMGEDEISDMSAQLFSRQPRVFREEHTCDVCGKSFSTEKYLQMHSSLHGAATPARNLVAENYKANDFRELDGLKSSWTCKICNKVFAQNSSFKNHMRTHSDERPFVCDICSIGFKERYHLKKHMLFKHSDELKEKCQFCGKRFKDSTAVRAHERIHSEHRPYHCRRCGKAFKTSECLWHHENRSKTCGALGGPPLPPLPKKGRVARRTRIASASPAVYVQSSDSGHVQRQSPAPIAIQAANLQNSVLQSFMNNDSDNNAMLELVQQFIQSEANKNNVVKSLQQYTVGSALQHNNNHVTGNGNQMMHQTQNINAAAKSSGDQIHMIATSTGAQLTTTNMLKSTSQSLNLPGNIAILPSTVARTPAMTSSVYVKAAHAQNVQPKIQTNQSNVTKLGQGQQQVVFTLPMGRDSNADAAAQVTQAILDAINNTAGQMKGVNIQRTIQCAVSQVQEVFGGSHQRSLASMVQQNAQPMVAFPVMTTTVSQPHMTPVMKAVPAQGMHPVNLQTVTVSIKSTTAAETSVNSTVSTTAISKPYTISILPPISSVAQNIQKSGSPSSEEGQGMDMDEEYYSSDSDDGEGYDEAAAAELATATSSILTSTSQDGGQNNMAAGSWVTGSGPVRPVATVQPLRRNTGAVERSSSTESDASLAKNSSVTREPIIVQPHRNKKSNYTCPKCQKGFAVPSAYQKHLLKHEEVRPFRCETCDIGFKLKVHLKKHNLYRHSDAYPCECSICGKRFKDSSAVRLHERIHSEDRPFECGCGKSFKTKENLWGHQNRKMCPYAGHPAQMRNESEDVSSGVGQNDVVVSNNNETTGPKFRLDISLASSYANRFIDNGYQAEGQTRSAPTIVITKAKEEPVEDDKKYMTGQGAMLPSIETFSTASQLFNLDHLSQATVTQLINAMQSQSIKKESMAEQCPTIQSLLRKAPPCMTKLPGIQQLFKHHIKPPPPYPGYMTPPRFADGTPSPSSYQGSSASPSPQQSISSSPSKSPISRQNSQSSLAGFSTTHDTPQQLLNLDQLYSSALTTKDPFWRCAYQPSGRKGSELASPSTEYCPVSIGIPKSPRSPRCSSALSPAASQCSELSMGGQSMFWEEESCERKPVLAQWQSADSDILFMELSTNVLSQI